MLWTRCALGGRCGAYVAAVMARRASLLVGESDYPQRPSGALQEHETLTVPDYRDCLISGGGKETVTFQAATGRR